MIVKTKHFGEIEQDESKIIYFENGILGFEDFKEYTLLFDNEEGDSPVISWLQSIEEPLLALPVMSPYTVKPDYNPEVEDELLKPLGDLNDENIVILVSLTVPNDIKKMTANMKAPFIINADSKKGCQIIAENSDYEVRYMIHDILKSLKEEKGAK
ncbi:MAG: hypothetical protein K0S47_774 [Herbinix sp.]|nr:hypothetical protein [Herbinix sp.]